MASQKLTVEVTPLLTVDDTTAFTILGLLELYCRANKKTIEVGHSSPVGKEDYSVYFNIVDDKFFKEDNK